MPGRLSLILLAGLVAAGCDAGNGTEKKVPPRVVEARRLLAEAGYPGGKGLPPLEILYNTNESHKKLAATIQQMWRHNLGVEVSLRNSEWKVYLDDMSKLRYQIMRRGWIGDYRDPNTFIEMFTTHSGNNNTGWSNEEFDGLVKQAAAEPDPDKRLKILARAEKILLDAHIIIPIYFYVSSNCWKDHVKGLQANIQDIHPLKEVVAEGRDTLVINNATEVQTLDPGLARGVPEGRMLIGLFEGLTTVTPGTLDPAPGVAERWDLSPDGRTYTFHLRDCEWSDGKKVTAADFDYAWRRVLDPAFPGDYAHQFYYIKGAEAYHLKKSTDASSLGIHVVDDRTLRVELVNPCAFFLDLCAFYSYYPVRKDVVEKYGTEWTKPEHMVSNGAFRLAERKLTDSTTIEKNPKYWDAAKVKQPKIKFLPIENALTAWNIYKEGNCDWVTALPLEIIDEVVKRPDYRGDTYLGTYFYSFNVTEGVLKDVRLRKALSLAIDREIIVSKILRQGQLPAYHVVPPAWPKYKSPRLDAKSD